MHQNRPPHRLNSIARHALTGKTTAIKRKSPFYIPSTSRGVAFRRSPKRISPRSLVMGDEACVASGNWRCARRLTIVYKSRVRDAGIRGDKPGSQALLSRGLSPAPVRAVVIIASAISCVSSRRKPRARNPARRDEPSGAPAPSRAKRTRGGGHFPVTPPQAPGGSRSGTPPVVPGLATLRPTVPSPTKVATRVGRALPRPKRPCGRGSGDRVGLRLRSTIIASRVVKFFQNRWCRYTILSA